MSLLTQALEQILKWSSKHYPLTVTRLNQGLSYAEIKRLTKDWPIQPPTEIYELYQWRNGVGDGFITCEFAGLFDIWGFLPLENVSLKKQPSPYEYELEPFYYSLNIFFSYESFLQGYLVFNDKGETNWVEFGEVIDGFYIRKSYYTNLTNMLLTIAESYKKVHFQDSQNNWIKNEELQKKIWNKYNSSKISESTLTQFIQKPSFYWLNQLMRNHLDFLEPKTQDTLIQILQKIQQNSEDKRIIEMTTRILEQPRENFYQKFNLSTLLKEYWKIREPEVSEFERFCFLVEKVNVEEDIKQIDKNRREEDLKRAVIFLLFMLKAANTLIQALKHNDVGIRREAAWALGEIKDLKAVDSLIETLSDSDQQVRQAAREALTKLILENPELEDLIPF
ncbi:hypothetical protein C7H19_15475 [Aphanothece hegewaldii CCALA 016]|uniref:Knr4/Smi1-like domain-containing protein n=1 Tax=Aphanothece hegewaldii CCALA 016 TaxID=2107694 RepID=A0A2T1LVR4_9CHRO|nr:HEAT repeat domain-containing protein [Aphanothece hegewaldii]PSF35822.1 hypothetical protein C7H19_15475 [Aphanothece hegewaldii CCALA 016]